MLASALSNVLLITILISILSNKFAEINANAQEEVCHELYCADPS